MLRLGFVLLGLSCLLPASDSLVKPDKLTIHTWVREDIFAGVMVNDLEALARGEKKLQVILAENPKDAPALAWMGLAMSVRMREARKNGDEPAYARLLVAREETMRKALEARNPADLSPFIIIGGSQIIGAEHAPEAQKAAMYREGRENLRKVLEGQKAYFNQLPPHMRGEMWSQLALASDRLGDTAERDRILSEMVTKLAGTPYENRAKRWQKAPELKSEADHRCISCHEPGRLEATLARLNAAAGK